MSFNSINKAFENRFNVSKNILNEELQNKEVKANAKSKLLESVDKILSERHWKFTIPGNYRNAIFDAADEEDFDGVRFALMDICQYVVDHIEESEEFDEESIEDIKDEYSDLLEELDYQDFEDEDECNYWLNELYDLMDNTDIFLGLRESFDRYGGRYYEPGIEDANDVPSDNNYPEELPFDDLSDEEEIVDECLKESKLTEGKDQAKIWEKRKKNNEIVYLAGGYQLSKKFWTELINDHNELFEKILGADNLSKVYKPQSLDKNEVSSIMRNIVKKYYDSYEDQTWREQSLSQKTVQLGDHRFTEDGYENFGRWLKDKGIKAKKLSDEELGKYANQFFDVYNQKYGEKFFTECLKESLWTDLVKKVPELAENINEDTEKTPEGKWVNKGKEGTHGEFRTKKEADAQRKAMFANGYKESLEESLNEDAVNDDFQYKYILRRKVYNTLADLCFDFHKRGRDITAEEMDLAYDWFATHFWDSDDYMECLNEDTDVSKIIIPKPYDKYFKISDEDPSLEGYEIGEELPEYHCRFLALLEPKKEEVEDIYPILTDDPDYPVVEDIMGRLTPVELPFDECLTEEKTFGKNSIKVQLAKPENMKKLNDISKISDLKTAKNKFIELIQSLDCTDQNKKQAIFKINNINNINGLYGTISTYLLGSKVI